MNHRVRPILRDLADRTFDVLVIGGGACGAAVAREAAVRGLSTALIEKGDFGEGASAHCLKMVHGGIRYLQHLDIRRLRNSCQERAMMLRIAPHLVAPLSIAVPTYGWGKHGWPFLAAGMTVYDLLSFDRNRGSRDAARRISNTRLLSSRETLEQFPHIESNGLTGAVVFQDGQMFSTTRLVWGFVDAAREAGAVVANYVRAETLLRRNDQVEGAAVADVLSGERFDIRARVVINAAGSWAEGLLASGGIDNSRYQGKYSRDTCFVIDRAFAGPFGLAIQGKGVDSDAVVGRGVRHMFLAPWRDKTLVGVWHRIVDPRPDEIGLPAGQLQSFVDEINAILPALQLTLADIRMTGFGLVPFGDTQQDGAALSFGHQSRLIDHAERDGVRGVLTAISVRYTVARQDAVTVLDLANLQLGKGQGGAATIDDPLPGGDIDDVASYVARACKEAPAWLGASGADSLVRNFGTRHRRVLDVAAAQPDLARLVDGTDVSLAEVAYVCRHELARTLCDVIFRRTHIGTGEAPTPLALEQVASVLRDELQASGDDIARDRVAVMKHVERYWASRPASAQAAVK